MRKDFDEVFFDSTHQVSFPLGFTSDSLLYWLKNFTLDNAPTKELEGYLLQDFLRFVTTLNLIPPGRGRILEIGSNPYFTSLLIKKFTLYDLSCLNYFNGLPKTGAQTMRNSLTEECFTFEYVNCNIEKDEIPGRLEYDIILCCEVLEHLTQDPLLALLRLHRALKPGGILILSTPNVARLSNVAKLISGANIYDPYSGYGPYGRHNREYNKHELFLLLTHLGFSIETLFSADVHENDASNYCDINVLKPLLLQRSADLGQYIFLRCVSNSTPMKARPAWLYRSYAADELCE